MRTVETQVLFNTWHAETGLFCADDAIISHWWDYLVNQYNQPNRHYHNLTHIQSLLSLANTHKDIINNWPAFYFAIWFHDAIQEKLRNNEQHSADMAKRAMSALGLPDEVAQVTAQLILATAKHEQQDLDDANLFIDMDLAILGQGQDLYDRYSQQCRLEFSVPDWVYRKGRTKVLRQLLEQKPLYQTPLFQEKYEHQARLNVERELSSLS